ncbi:MAG: alpha/beta hydrolase [Oliverpabstia sp.]
MIHQIIDLKVDYQKAGAVQDGSQPRLYTYVMEESEELVNSHCRPAVIVCPGGAYRFTSDREAEIVAMRYLAAGIQAFVLRYSVAPSCYPSALLELAEAVSHVRNHAKDYYINPEKIVIAGFSAGGHLCACLGNLWDDPVIKNVLGEDSSLWKPNGMILSYPVITMGEFTHEESRRLLLGEDYTEEMAESLSMEKRVTEKTVPTFLWHTQEDMDVPVENSLEFAMALRKNHIPFELHVYEEGGHGLSLCDDTVADTWREFPQQNANWIQMAVQWLKRL